MDEPKPQYLPREHVETFLRHRALVRIFDQAFRVPGTNWRFGLDAVLGLFPGIGDLLGAAFAAYGILLARRMGAPAAVQLRMIANVFVDSTLGSVPVAGDLFDAAFKAHRRNHALLERWLEQPRRTERVSRLALWAVPVAALLAIAAVVGLAIAAAAWAWAYFDSAAM
ncbi:MAG: DUF4112 domain-containing protein [Gammaproteobacteria bacterium]|nr:DUF4112 domain-containing protein [Gammaproteobacteria bacterium]